MSGEDPENVIKRCENGEAYLAVDVNMAGSIVDQASFPWKYKLLVTVGDLSWVILILAGIVGSIFFSWWYLGLVALGSLAARYCQHLNAYVVRRRALTHPEFLGRLLDNDVAQVVEE